MVFSSLEFLLLFLPVFLIIYYLSPPRYRNMCLLMASLAFYAYGVRAHIAYLFLLLASVCINFFLGLFIERYHRKSILILGLLYNLGVLFVFKYSGFFFASVLRVATQPFQPELPIGISFYTFQAVSYLIDIYRRTTPAEQNLVCFGTYIIMFPQLIAGPIVRYQDIRKRLHRRRCTPRAFLHGLSQFVFGLGLKVILANRIGNLWSSVCGIGFESVSTPLAWMGILACSLQIYFDFWGYSQMAIGLGRMIGFTLPVNFRHPYQARSMTDFWRRWHITLGAWFREYVYIPLGGSRKGTARTILNILIVFLISGLWHGASWTFVIWGLLHGLSVAWSHRKHFRLKDGWLSWACMFLYTIPVSAIFRSETVDNMCRILKAMFVPSFTGFFPELTGAVKQLSELYVPVKLLELKDPYLMNYFCPAVVFVLLAVTAFVLHGKNTQELLASQKEKGFTRSFTLFLVVFTGWALISLTQVSTFLYFNF